MSDGVPTSCDIKNLDLSSAALMSNSLLYIGTYRGQRIEQKVIICQSL